MWTLFEPLHAVTYFAPEGRAAFEAAGLRGFWRGYFASRSAPLGLAPAAVTTALYANFAPRMVERAIPSVWELASPEEVLAARLDGLGRRAGPAARRRGRAARRPACCSRSPPPRPPPAARSAPRTPPSRGPPSRSPCSGRPPPCCASSAATGTSSPSSRSGLDGLSTMVLRSGHDLDREALQPNRGWTDEEWAAAAASLADRGLLGPDGRITAAGSDAARPSRGPHRRAGPGAVDDRRPRRRVAVRRARRTAGARRPYGAAAGQPDRAAAGLSGSGPVSAGRLR